MKTARFVACALPLLCSSAALAQTTTYAPAAASTAVTLPPLQADSLSPTPPADVNGDGAVNGGDLGEILATFGSY